MVIDVEDENLKACKDEVDNKMMKMMMLIMTTFSIRMMMRMIMLMITLCTDFMISVCLLTRLSNDSMIIVLLNDNFKVIMPCNEIIDNMYENNRLL